MPNSRTLAGWMCGEEDLGRCNGYSFYESNKQTPNLEKKTRRLAVGEWVEEKKETLRCMVYVWKKKCTVV